MDISNCNLYDLSKYDYHLPEELIAQSPAEPRDSSRLLVLHRNSGEINHAVFRDLPSYLRKGDVIVLNNTKVMAARLFGKKEGGTAEIEVLLLCPLSHDNLAWEALVRPGKRVKPGRKVVFPGGEKIEIAESLPSGTRRVLFEQGTDPFKMMETYGRVPLPPYIRSTDAEPDRYQTIFAERLGSAATPTAGLHFTPKLLDELERKGVKIAHVTLHVGIGTFKPIAAKDVRQHKMHAEFCSLPDETAKLINETKRKGGKIVAVGTTVVRTLETMVDDMGAAISGSGWTQKFIYPGYTFRIIDALITNFHLPKSTLMLLVSAFAGYENIMNAYQEAIKLRYRFYSFGDAMLII